MKLAKNTLFASIFLFLSACGGGNSESPPNTPPTISVSNLSVSESATASISATIQDEGTIQTILWEQVSGTSVSLLQADTSTVSFDSPAVIENETIQLRVSATDDAGETTSALVEIEVLSNRLAFSISGVVYDGPVSSADISLTGEGVNVSGVANEAGEYTLEVDFDDSFADVVLKLTANGVDDQDFIKLESILGSVLELDELAGEDQLLDSSELFRTNITNVTTALTLATEAANQGTITSLEEFNNAKRNLDPALILPYATVQKLVIDFAAEDQRLALPDNVENTIGLLQDDVQFRAYVQNAVSIVSERTFPKSIYQTALEEILSDPILLGLDLSRDAIIGKYYTESVPEVHVASDTIKLNLSGQQLVFNADGTGVEITPPRVDQLATELMFTWQKTDEGTVVTYIDPPVVSFSRTTNIENIPYTEEQRDIKAVFKRVYSDEGITLFTKETTTAFTFSLPGLDSVEEVTVYAFKAYNQSSIANAQTIVQIGSTYSVSVPDAILRLQNEMTNSTFFVTSAVRQLQFQGDPMVGGTATMRAPEYSANGAINYREKSVDWSINSSGEIALESADESIVVSILSKNTDEELNVSTALDSETITTAMNGSMQVHQSDWTSENAVGIFIQRSESFDSRRTLNWYSWYETYADGTGYRLSVEDQNGDGSITSEDRVFPEPLLWQRDAEGNLILRRYRSSTSLRFCEPPVFNPTPLESCALYSQLILDMLSSDDSSGKFETEQTSMFFNDFRLKRSNPELTTTNSALRNVSTSIAGWKRLDARPIEVPDELLIQ